jgi:hypothetical protein
LIVEDTFAFSQAPFVAQEGFVTWNNTLVAGGTALILGAKHVLELTIQKPQGAAFVLEVLDQESRANNKPVPLKRLSFEGQALESPLTARLRIRVLPQ